MKFAKSCTAVAVLGLFAAGNALAWDQARNLKPIFGDVHAAPGHEVTIPFLQPVDGNSDGYPEKIKIKFNVYTAGTATLRRATDIKTVSTPAIPAGCTPTQAGNSLDSWIFAARRDELLNSSGGYVAENKRLHIALNMVVACGANDTVTGIVYSADLSGTESSGSPGPTWFKAFPGKMIEGLNGEDVDKDLVNDLLLITTGQPTATGWKLGLYYVAGKSGGVNTTITTSKGNSYTLPTSAKLYTVSP